MGAFRGSSKLKIFQGGTKVKKAYLGATKIYSSGNIVTYVVDSGVTYSEEVDEGASVLVPDSFTPTKSGWEFVGWREDEAASGDVLSSKVMGDEPVILYAVYSQTITLSYDGNSATSGSVSNQTGMRYYNAYGNDNNPTFVLAGNGFLRTGYTFTGWNLGAAGATVTLSASTTAYAQWKLAILEIFNGGITRSGDSWVLCARYTNDGSDEEAYRTAYGTSVLYASGNCGNWDRRSVAGGMLTQAIDISAFSKLCVTISSAVINNGNNSQWYVGVRNSVISGEENSDTMPWISGCTLLSQSTSGGTYTLDLSTYKSTYGNTAYFLYGAGKTIAAQPGGGATVTITRVWFE